MHASRLRLAMPNAKVVGWNISLPPSLSKQIQQSACPCRPAIQTVIFFQLCRRRPGPVMEREKARALASCLCICVRHAPSPTGTNRGVAAQVYCCLPSLTHHPPPRPSLSHQVKLRFAHHTHTLSLAFYIFTLVFLPLLPPPTH